MTNSEQQNVERAIQFYFDGTEKADIPTLKKGYTEGCRIYFINDSGDLDFLDQQKFHEVVTEMHQQSGKRVNEIHSIEITDNICIAKTTADYPGFFFTDYLSLMKIANEWKIVNKITVKQNK